MDALTNNFTDRVQIGDLVAESGEDENLPQSQYVVEMVFPSSDSVWIRQLWSNHGREVSRSAVIPVPN